MENVKEWNGLSACTRSYCAFANQLLTSPGDIQIELRGTLMSRLTVALRIACLTVGLAVTFVSEVKSGYLSQDVLIFKTPKVLNKILYYKYNIRNTNQQ